jgi:hypothetical protein
MLSPGATRLPTYAPDRPSYTVAANTQRLPIHNSNVGERIIPIETTTSPYRV